MATNRTAASIALPDGFVYRPNFITVAEEQELLRVFETLEFKPFEYLTYTAKRRVVVYGWDYDFTSHKTSEIDPIPVFLHPLRLKTAEFLNIDAESLVEAVINEYPPGAPIGWHRDVPQFEIVAGISLLSTCRMRLRPYKAEGKPLAIALEPRSLYILSCDARWKWQHSIPAVKELRYSITFRTLRAEKG